MDCRRIGQNHSLSRGTPCPVEVGQTITPALPQAITPVTVQVPNGNNYVVPLSTFSDQIATSLGHHDHLANCLDTVRGLLSEANNQPIVGVTAPSSTLTTEQIEAKIEALIKAERRARDRGDTARAEVFHMRGRELEQLLLA